MNINEFKTKLPAGVSLIPILFSTPMVQAIMDGRKTQTRRTVKTPRHKLAAGFKINSTIDGSHKWPEAIDENERGLEGNGCNMECPYGKPGDILWVRESWRGTPGDYVYKANCSDTWVKLHSWRPSIHMPFEACRTFLMVKSVRLERLQDISEEDARVEGIPNAAYSITPKESFSRIWKSINGPESWDANPWVWVVEFERYNP